MSIFQPVQQKTNEIDSKIANTLDLLIKGILNITEFNEKELKAISILQTDYRMKKYLAGYLSNKKHIKRKHSDELIKALKTISESISHGNQPEFPTINENSHFWRK
jgi:argininosuccinate lyase